MVGMRLEYFFGEMLKGIGGAVPPSLEWEEADCEQSWVTGNEGGGGEPAMVPLS